jgi:hypothetical protein
MTRRLFVALALLSVVVGCEQTENVRPQAPTLTQAPQCEVNDRSTIESVRRIVQESPGALSVEQRAALIAHAERSRNVPEDASAPNRLYCLFAASYAAAYATRTPTVGDEPVLAIMTSSAQDTEAACRDGGDAGHCRYLQWYGMLGRVRDLTHSLILAPTADNTTAAEALSRDMQDLGRLAGQWPEALRRFRAPTPTEAQVARVELVDAACRWNDATLSLEPSLVQNAEVRGVLAPVLRESAASVAQGLEYTLEPGPQRVCDAQGAQSAACQDQWAARLTTGCQAERAASEGG